ncbi:MAG: nicotinamide riboside transporter PnuC [Clostridia bacterium]|nr:nicotinamide riboside transporter PnuC [Clostridia bacterium]
MKKFLKSITLIEWLIWSISVITIIVFFFVFKNTQYLYLVGSLIGATALIFVSKGNPMGQVLTIVFSVFYGIISYSYHYYGEMITYLGMSAPFAIWALISWLSNPYKGNKNEVKVNALSKKEWGIFLTAAVVITIAFYFALRALNIANLIVSTISVLTSFLAAYLTARRSRFYAIFYGVNDVVLIIMWSMASQEDITYLPMVICFVAFFIADTYGFINWSIMNKRQNAEASSLSKDEKNKL